MEQLRRPWKPRIQRRWSIIRIVDPRISTVWDSSLVAEGAQIFDGDLDCSGEKW